MARYTGPVCRLCRREGQKLFLKGARCHSQKCGFTQRSYAPGQHGQSRKKSSEYGLQLREKQKARRYYGVLESQFEKYFDLAVSKRGITGENLLQILESRFDNVVYRLGFALSRPEARQLVRHGHFEINGKKVDIPSYLLKPGEIISIKDKSKDLPKFKAIFDAVGSRLVPTWLSLDAENYTAKVEKLAPRDEIGIQLSEHLIVELYSK